MVLYFKKFKNRKLHTKVKMLNEAINININDLVHYYNFND